MLFRNLFLLLIMCSFFEGQTQKNVTAFTTEYLDKSGKYVFADSLVFKTSGQREVFWGFNKGNFDKGDFNYNYDTLVWFKYKGSRGPYCYEKSLRGIKKYDFNNNVILRKTERWDTLSNNWLTEDSTINVFNLENQIIESNTFYRFLFETKISHYIKRVFDYNSQSKRIDRVRHYMIWDDNIDTFTNYTDSVFDNTGSIHSIRNTTWDNKSKDYSTHRKIYFYYYNGKLKEQKILLVNANGKGFRNYRRIVNTFDGKGNITETVFMKGIDTTDWLPTTRFEYTFNSQSLVSKKTVSKWSSDKNTLIFDEKEEYSYSNGNNVKTELFKWDTASTSWKIWFTRNKKYDSFDNLIEEVNLSSVSTANGQLEAVNRTQYSYFKSTKVQTKKQTDYLDNNIWIPQSRLEWFINKDSYPDSLVSRYWDSTAKSWLYYPNDLFTNGIYVHRLVFHYQKNTNTNVLNPNSFEIEKYNVYPNPFHNQLTLNIASKKKASGKLIIRDVLGKAIKKEGVEFIEGENYFNYSLAEVKRGIYFITLTTDAFSLTQKVIKQ